MSRRATLTRDMCEADTGCGMVFPKGWEGLVDDEDGSLLFRPYDTCAMESFGFYLSADDIAYTGIKQTRDPNGNGPLTD